MSDRRCAITVAKLDYDPDWVQYRLSVCLADLERALADANRAADTIRDIYATLYPKPHRVPESVIALNAAADQRAHGVTYIEPDSFIVTNGKP